MKYGNSDALGWVIERYAAYINTVIYNIIGSIMTPLDVEEVASDVFLTLWENTEKVDADKLKAFLGSVARNKAKNKLRELGTEVFLEDDVIVISSDTPENDVKLNIEKALRYQHFFNATKCYFSCISQLITRKFMPPYRRALFWSALSNTFHVVQDTFLGGEGHIVQHLAQVLVQGNGQRIQLWTTAADCQTSLWVAVHL